MDSKVRHSRATPNVKAACEECRSRKTKCDGTRPACARCHKKAIPCVYDAEPDEYRATALRRKCKMWENQALAGERVLHALRDLPENESVNLLRRLRQDENIEEILQSLADSGSDGIGRRGRALSDATSHYSDGSAATSSGSTQESSSHSHQSQAQQHVHFATQDAQAGIPDRSRLQDRLSIGFLMNNGDHSGPDDKQQARMQIDQNSTPSSHNFNRTNSYPPVTPASPESRRRISAPGPGPMAIDSQGYAAEAINEASRDGGVGAEGPGISTEWDHYYTTVSRLMRKIGEGNEPRL